MRIHTRTWTSLDEAVRFVWALLTNPDIVVTEIKHNQPGWTVIWVE